MGTLTFGSLAQLSDYRTQLASTARKTQTAAPASTVSSKIPNGPVDARTDQALIWSGLRSESSKNESPQTALLSSYSAYSSSYSSEHFSPDLDFAYSMASIKGILAYREALKDRMTETAPQVGQNLAES